MIVFVNGKIGGGSPPAGIAYWNGADSSFVRGAVTYWQDEHLFFPVVDYGGLSTVKGRMRRGFRYAKAHRHLLDDGLEPKETFKFVTHSMGAAFAEGMAAYLVDQGYRVEEMVHISPFQATRIPPPTSSFTQVTDYQNTDDWVIHRLPLIGFSGDIEHADYRIRERSIDPDWITRHRCAIDLLGGDFWSQLARKKMESTLR